jgi:hypothetical protein
MSKTLTTMSKTLTTMSKTLKIISKFDWKRCQDGRKRSRRFFFRWQQKSFKRIQCASSARCIDVKRTYLGTCFNYVSIPVNPMDGSHDFYVHNFILWLHRYTVSI